MISPNDAQDFGGAWFAFRSVIPGSQFPGKYLARFKVERVKLMTDNKDISLKSQQVLAAKHEVEALLNITAKAARKGAIAKAKKEGQVLAQRPITDGRDQARDVAKQLANLLKQLRTPASFESKPGNIHTGATGLKTTATTAGSLQKSRDLHLARSLPDTVVKYHLAQAAQRAAKAKADIRAQAADYSAAKQAIAKIEASAKQLKIT